MANTYKRLKKVVSRKFLVFGDVGGSSLIEILIALAIGALLIGAASFALVFVLRSSTTNQGLHAATLFGEDYIRKAYALGESSWQNLYGLEKGASSSYMILPSVTGFSLTKGREGVLENDITQNLVMHLKLDEDPSVSFGATYDFSLSQNDGDLINLPTRLTSGCYAGNCISFDGIDDRVLIDTPLNNFPAGSTTVSLWVNVSSHADSYEYINNNFPGGVGRWALRSSASGEVMFSVIDSSLVEHSARGCGSGFTLNAWHLITGTYDNSFIKVYLDGVLCDSKSMPNQTLYTGGVITVGEWGSSGVGLHVLDEVRIYSKALKESEVSHLFRAMPATRYLFVENVCRTNDGLQIISNNYPCTGLIEDSSTQKITVIAEWRGGGVTYTNRLIEYLTRFKNKVFDQSDWSGGSGVDFSSSTNIDYTDEPGSIKILGI